MKRSGILILVLSVFLGCKSSPPAVDQYPPVEEEIIDEPEVEEPATDSGITVSQEVYDFTLAEVKLFIDSLNSLIMKKNYNGWKNALSDDFFDRISSPEFLAAASESAILKSKKIVLKSPNDYFLQVVVPSRSNSRVDEIEFTDTNKVKVYYREERVRRNSDNSVSAPEVRRLRLYELIKIGDTWKIID